MGVAIFIWTSNKFFVVKYPKFEAHPYLDLIITQAGQRGPRSTESPIALWCAECASMRA